MNGQVEVAWRTLCTVAHSLMVHARVPEVYVHFALMYTTDHIFPVLTVKDLKNEDGNPTITHKLETGTKPSVSHLHVLFCPCVGNGEKCKMRKIDLCEGGLQLADIVTKNVSEPDLTPRIKCIIVRLENLDSTLVQEG